GGAKRAGASTGGAAAGDRQGPLRRRDHPLGRPSRGGDGGAAGPVGCSRGDLGLQPGGSPLSAEDRADPAAAAPRSDRGVYRRVDRLITRKARTWTIAASAWLMLTLAPGSAGATAISLQSLLDVAEVCAPSLATVRELVE